jgi:hypothetical protein
MARKIYTDLVMVVAGRRGVEQRLLRVARVHLTGKGSDEFPSRCCPRTTRVWGNGGRQVRISLLLSLTNGGAFLFPN